MSYYNALSFANLESLWDCKIELSHFWTHNSVPYISTVD